METLRLNLIRCDGGTQSRAFSDQLTVLEYKAGMERGVIFPPVVAFFDGSEYWMADGFHRWQARADMGAEMIDVDVRQGTKRDAMLFSAGANSQHGLKRNNADKRRAVLMLLNDAEWGRWSPLQIAEKCGVGETFVRNVRSEQFPTVRNSKGRDGKSYPAKKAPRAPKPPTDAPNSTTADLSDKEADGLLPNRQHTESNVSNLPPPSDEQKVSATPAKEPENLLLQQSSNFASLPPDNSKPHNSEENSFDNSPNSSAAPMAEVEPSREARLLNLLRSALSFIPAMEESAELCQAIEEELSHELP